MFFTYLSFFNLSEYILKFKKSFVAKMVTQEVEKLNDFIGVYVFGAMGIGFIIVFSLVIKQFYSWLGYTFWDYIKKKLFATSKMTNKIRTNIKFINDLVVETRNTLSADRCYVLEFHNGEYFSSRESRWKVSQVYESCSEGTSSQGKDFKDIDVSMLWSSFQVYFSHENDAMPNGISIFMPEGDFCNAAKQCIAPKRVYLFDVEKIENRFHKSLLEREGVTYMLHSPILNENNDVVGIMGVDYTNRFEFEKAKKAGEITVCELCKAADQIAYSWALMKTKKGRT